MCRKFFAPIAREIKNDGPRGSVVLALKVQSWVDHTDRCKKNRRCRGNGNCLKCRAVTSQLTAAERRHLKEAYLT